MQAAPPVQVLVQSFGAWNGLLISLSIAALGVSGGWFIGHSDVLPAWVAVVMVAALSFALVGAWTSRRRHPFRLRWDSQRWYLTEGEIPADESGPSHVQVMLDAGSWLLLRIVPEDRSSPLAARWLPVQRRGIPDQWHALRCAVYCPRLKLTRPSSLDGPIRIE